MSEKARVYLFHIRRSDGRSLILHPFKNRSRIVGQMEDNQMVGRYGAEPRVEALTAFRDELYGSVDAAVNAWRADARFIPRFLLSALVFVAAYLFFSYVIRDPIPVVDDMIYALGASFLVYTLIKRKDPTSEPAARKRAALTAIVDSIRFAESPFVLKVEGILHRHEGEDLTDLAKRIASLEGTVLTEEEREEALQFLALLEGALLLPARRRSKSGPRPGAEDRAAAKDLPLYATYRGLRRTVSAAEGKP